MGAAARGGSARPQPLPWRLTRTSAFSTLDEMRDADLSDVDRCVGGLSSWTRRCGREPATRVGRQLRHARVARRANVRPRPRADALFSQQASDCNCPQLRHRSAPGRAWVGTGCDRREACWRRRRGPGTSRISHPCSPSTGAAACRAGRPSGRSARTWARVVSWLRAGGRGSGARRVRFAAAIRHMVRPDAELGSIRSQVATTGVPLARRSWSFNRFTAASTYWVNSIRRVTRLAALLLLGACCPSLT